MVRSAEAERKLAAQNYRKAGRVRLTAANANYIKGIAVRGTGAGHQMTPQATFCSSDLMVLSRSKSSNLGKH